VELEKFCFLQSNPKIVVVVRTYPYVFLTTPSHSDWKRTVSNFWPLGSGVIATPPVDDKMASDCLLFQRAFSAHGM